MSIKIPAAWIACAVFSIALPTTTYGADKMKSDHTGSSQMEKPMMDTMAKDMKGSMHESMGESGEAGMTESMEKPMMDTMAKDMKGSMHESMGESGEEGMMESMEKPMMDSADKPMKHSKDKPMY